MLVDHSILPFISIRFALVPWYIRCFPFYTFIQVAMNIIDPIEQAFLDREEKAKSFIADHKTRIENAIRQYAYKIRLVVSEVKYPWLKHCDTQQWLVFCDDIQRSHPRFKFVYCDCDDNEVVTVEIVFFQLPTVDTLSPTQRLVYNIQQAQQQQQQQERQGVAISIPTVNKKK